MRSRASDVALRDPLGQHRFFFGGQQGRCVDLAEIRFQRRLGRRIAGLSAAPSAADILQFFVDELVHRLDGRDGEMVLGQMIEFGELIDSGIVHGCRFSLVAQASGPCEAPQQSILLVRKDHEMEEDGRRRTLCRLVPTRSSVVYRPGRADDYSQAAR
jgi:hypothetical protein